MKWLKNRKKMQEFWNKIQKCMRYDLNGLRYFWCIFCMHGNIFNNLNMHEMQYNAWIYLIMQKCKNY